MGFFIVPDFPILIDGWLSPEISSGDDVSYFGFVLIMFFAEDEFQMGLSGAFDKLREFSFQKSERARLSSINVDVLGLKISIDLLIQILARFWVWVLKSFDYLFIDLNKLYLKSYNIKIKISIWYQPFKYMLFPRVVDCFILKNIPSFKAQ